MPGRDSLSDAFRSVRDGEEGALDRLVPLIYEDLRRLARRQLARRHGPETLDTTGVVHETYLKLAGHQGAAWRDRGHFFAVAARAMRHILIDYAKRRHRRKRGGGLRRVTLDETRLPVEQEADHILAIDAALGRLAAVDARLVRIVECRFFAGLSAEETAEALGVSARTVERDWARARSWLKTEIAR